MRCDICGMSTGKKWHETAEEAFCEDCYTAFVEEHYLTKWPVPYDQFQALLQVTKKLAQRLHQLEQQFIDHYYTHADR